MFMRHHALLENINGKPQFAASFSVTVYRPGTWVSGDVAASLSVTVNPNFPIPATGAGLLFGIDENSYRVVQSVFNNTLTLDVAITLADGTSVTDLGGDTGSAISFANSTAIIYSNPSTLAVAANSQLLTDAVGEYQYWTEEPEVWEVIRITAATDSVAAVVKEIIGPLPARVSTLSGIKARRGMTVKLAATGAGDISYEHMKLSDDTDDWVEVNNAP